MEDMDFYRNMLESMYEGIYFVDLERKITFWNKKAEDITGFTANEILGKKCMDNILNHVDDKGTKLCLTGCPLHKTIMDGVRRETPIYLHHKEGHRVKVYVKTTPIYEEGKVVGCVEVFTDDPEISVMAKNVEELKQLALYDQLTGLPNRRYMENYLNNKLKEKKELGIPFALAFLDIDHFRDFNNNYGHEIGDDVLKMVSKTYGNALRRNDVVGRWGGEEFIAVLSGADEQGSTVAGEKIRMLVENSVLRTGEQELHVTVSIGITPCKEEDSLESLVKRADELMYQSKEAGRNRVTVG